MSNSDRTKKFNGKLIAIILIVVVAIGAVGWGVYDKVLCAKEVEEIPPQTVEVSKGTIEQTITATGSIISAAETTAFASTVTSYPVAEVYVKIGDVVKEGDPLYKLDMSSTATKLSYQQQALNIQQQQNDLAAANALLDYEESLENGSIKIVTDQKSLEEAEKKLADLKVNKSKYEEDYGRAEHAEDRAHDAYNAAVDKGDATAVASASASFSSASAEKQAIESKLGKTKDEIKDLEKQIREYNEKAPRTQTEADRANLRKARAMQSADLSGQASNVTHQQGIAETKRELSKAIVCATQDGTVTNVNIKPGQNYDGTNAVVIDDMDTLVASADIDEALIPKVVLGQKVNIKTDATGEEVMTGTVTFISPTATKDTEKDKKSESSTASVSKKRASYRVDVTIDGVNPSLRLGMTAKMIFIIEKKDNVLTVPSADIQTDESGNRYVVVQKTDGTTENVTVTTGINDDYHTEISGTGIKEGTVVIEEVGGDVNDMLANMGADGGIGDLE